MSTGTPSPVRRRLPAAAAAACPAPPRGARSTRLGRGVGALVGLVVASFLVAPGPALAGSGGQLCVGVVVAATQAGSDDRCVKVAPGSNGLDVLVARARAAGRPAPRIDSGQVCAIDGFPATGCGVPDGNGGYRYWSYWTKAPGASGWSYARTGAGGRKVADGGMEGWAFQDGGAEQSARPPARSASRVCPPEAAPRSAAPAASKAAQAPPKARASSPAVRPASPAARPTSPAARPGPPAGTRASASPRPASPAAGSRGSAVARAAGTAASPLPGDPVAAAPGVAGPVPTATPPVTAGATTATPTPDPATTAQDQALPGAVPASEQGGAPLGSLLGLGLVLGLGGAGLLLARRRAGA